MKELNDFGLFILAYREDHELNKKELGALIGVDAMTLAQWEKGKNSPRYDTLIKISRALKVPVTAFFPEDVL